MKSSLHPSRGGSLSNHTPTTPPPTTAPGHTQPTANLTLPQNHHKQCTVTADRTGLDNLSDPGEDLRQQRGHPAHRDGVPAGRPDDSVRLSIPMEP
ncbi:MULTISPECIES: hypothetical protein [unclassified Streptomyces]|jgi:hypothetical protein|uniref:hypothetical protein n=1 Tax=unclassified Streptomyces TaxID=2593676 RepID=UPI0022520E8B|nr:MULTISPECIES: hypothetical protein [unclassified Streptomyces]MCX4403733.1 hypothetical protein [Streptomyces sp. NBC_01764]MCX5181315.1 hypothetical protein [Streptomyces sp. NBC_00268]